MKGVKMEDHADIITEMVVFSDLVKDELESSRPDVGLIETLVESIGLSAEQLLIEIEE